MKITKRQLRRIIREAGSPDRVHSIDPLTGRDTEKLADPGIFSEDYIYDMFADDIMDFLQLERGTVNFLTEREVEMFRRADLGAVDKLMEDYG